MRPSLPSVIALTAAETPAGELAELSGSEPPGVGAP
jgi:hypothetical protein